MSHEQKLKRLQRFFFGQYIDAKNSIINRLKDASSCLCGKTSSEIHRKGCNRFNRAVEEEVIRQLQHLIDSINVKVGSV